MRPACISGGDSCLSRKKTVRFDGFVWMESAQRIGLLEDLACQQGWIIGMRFEKLCHRLGRSCRVVAAQQSCRPFAGKENIPGALYLL